MARIDVKRRKIQAKLVYYGPGLCGKTTNLQYINRNMAGEQELTSLATEGDMTIFFDFMPIDLGKLRGMDIQFKLYTVPGQVRYNQTRKMVLKNVDGIVFVADSQPLMMDANLESLDNLFENLGELGVAPEDVPLVLQYNKQDLPGVLGKEELDAALNQQNHPSILASAYTGDGVVATLKLAGKEILRELTQQMGSEGRAPTKPQAKAGAKPEALATRSATRSDGAAAKPAARPARASRKRAEPSESESKTRGEPVAHEAVSEDVPPKWFERWAAERMKQETLMRADLTLAVAGIRRAEAAQKEIRREVEGLRKESAAADERGPTRTDLKNVLVKLHMVQEAAEKVGKVGKTPGPSEALASRTEIEALDASIKAVAEGIAKISGETDKAATRADVEELAKRMDAAQTSGSSEGLGELGEKLGGLATREDLGRIAEELSKAVAAAPSTKATPEEWAALAKDVATKSDVEKLAKRLSSTVGPASSSKGELARLGKLATRKEFERIATAITARLEGLPTKTEFESLGRRIEELPGRQALEQIVGALIDQGGAAKAARTPAPSDPTAKEADSALASAEAGNDAAHAAEESGPDASAPTDDSAEATAASREDIEGETEAAAESDEAEAASDEAEAAAASDEAEAAAASGEAETPSDEVEAAAASDEAETPSDEAEAAAASDEAEAAAASDEEAAGDEATAASGEDEATTGAAEATASGEDATEAPATSDEAETTEAAGEPSAQPAEETAAAAPEDKRHKNAARIARVMIADLYLYHRDEVEAGLRDGDFDERNKEALSDIRGTYESRVPEDVRDEWDHVKAELGKAKNKWRKRLGLGDAE